MAWSARAALKQGAKFRIGREQHLRHGVEPGCCCQCQVLDRLAGGCGLLLGQQSQEPLCPARGVFVNIGVPARGERKVKVVRQPRAQNADLAGPRDMDQVRLKTPEHFADQRNVPEKRRIKAQILFENEGKRAPRQFEGPHAALLDQCRSAMAGAHAKKGKIAPSREVLKMAARMGDPIHFVKGVRKVRDARNRGGHIGSETHCAGKGCHANSANTADLFRTRARPAQAVIDLNRSRPGATRLPAAPDP